MFAIYGIPRKRRFYVFTEHDWRDHIALHFWLEARSYVRMRCDCGDNITHNALYPKQKKKKKKKEKRKHPTVLSPRVTDSDI